MPIEQAIFTSAETDRSAGYQIVAYSPGIDEVDLRDLSAWGPSHDSLLETGADAVSVNFHPLPSGAWCVSRTTPAGNEYSGRRGVQVYTQCLLVAGEDLLRFSNNPFALLTAAFAQGSLRVWEDPPPSLEPIRLGGKAAVCDVSLLGQLLADPGAEWMGAIVEAALNRHVALAASTSRTRLFAGLMNCLPVECRLQISFSTGLKHSARRPFRVIGLPDDRGEQRRLLRQSAVSVLDLAGPAPRGIAQAGWSAWVARALSEGDISLFAARLAEPRPGLTLAELDALGDQCVREFEVRRLGDVKAEPIRTPDARTAEAARAAEPVRPASRLQDDLKPAELDDDSLSPPAPGGHRADRAHQRFGSKAAAIALAATAALESDPSQVLGRACPEALERLELLDDTVFEAIAGKPGALDGLRTLWPQVLAQLGPRLVEESREQYVRHAVRVWRECLEGEQLRNPAIAIAALEVIEVLFHEGRTG